MMLLYITILSQACTTGWTPPVQAEVRQASRA